MRTENHSVTWVAFDWSETSRDPVVPVQRTQIGICFERQQWRQKQGNEADFMWREWFVGVRSQLQIRMSLYLFTYNKGSRHCGKKD